MQQEVIKQIESFWRTGRRLRQSTYGWVSGNAVCCGHRGHRPDSRGRGGIKVDHDRVNWHCFNCGYSTMYIAGQPLGMKMRRLLGWMGASEDEIRKLQLIALKAHNALGETELSPLVIADIKCELPEPYERLDPVKHPTHAEYLNRRGISLDSYTFYVSACIRQRMSTRVIVPFWTYDRLVGYTARTIADDIPKYIQKLVCPYVFGIDFQQPRWSWVPLTEGVFDALSIQGCAVLGNEVNEKQADLLDSLQKQIVVVPDADKAGNSLIQAAIDYGWGVSFPDWPSDVKDTNDAVSKWGRLFVLRQIWHYRETDPTQIKLRLKMRKYKQA